MLWQFRNDKPIYSQLVERITLAIATGELPAGSRLPSVRDMASDAGVNPNTLQRAFAELERQELLFTQRTSGRFVTEDTGKIEGAKERLIRERVDGFLSAMEALGCTGDEIVGMIVKEN